MTEKLQLSSGQDRLVMLIVFFFFFLHLSSCMFVIMADLEEAKYLYYTAS